MFWSFYDAKSLSSFQGYQAPEIGWPAPLLPWKVGGEMLKGEKFIRRVQKELSLQLTIDEEKLTALPVVSGLYGARSFLFDLSDPAIYEEAGLLPSQILRGVTLHVSSKNYREHDGDNLLISEVSPQAWGHLFCVETRHKINLSLDPASRTLTLFDLGGYRFQEGFQKIFWSIVDDGGALQVRFFSEDFLRRSQIDFLKGGELGQWRVVFETSLSPMTDALIQNPISLSVLDQKSQKYISYTSTALHLSKEHLIFQRSKEA